MMSKIRGDWALDRELMDLMADDSAPIGVVADWLEEHAQDKLPHVAGELNRYLNMNPSDYRVRLVLAEVYEDMEEGHKAYCLRLLARYRRNPRSSNTNAFNLWDWFTTYFNGPLEETDNDLLPGADGGLYNDKAWVSKRSRLELEVLGAEYLIRRGYRLEDKGNG